MTEYDLGKVVGDDGEAGNGIASITKTGTSGLVDTYTITYDDGTTTTFTVTNGSNASVTIQTSWGSTTSDSKVPSEKLTKDTLDTKIAKSSTTGLMKNDGTVMTSGTGSGNYAAGNHTHSGYVSATKVTSWQSTPSDSNVPSEKLTKETINALNVFDIGQNNSTNAVCLSKDIDSDGKGMAFANTILIYNENNDKLYYDKNTNGDTDSGNELATMNDIPSLANYVQKSSTSGLLKNDGSIDTSSYITSSAISGMLTSSDIADNLTTNDSTKVLSAKQGKALNDLIGAAITYINQ